MLQGPGFTLRLSLMLAAVFAAVLAAGCNASGQSAPTASPTIQDTPSATPSEQTAHPVSQAQIVSNLPTDFPIVPYVTNGVLPNGTSTLSALLAQGKPVILNFWAGNCPPCRAEMPGLQKMYDQLNSQVVLLGVDVGPFFGLGTHDQAKQLLQQLNITYPTGDTSDTSIVPKFKVAGLPSTYFLRPNGTVMKSWTGL
ncbi:MAG TPA: TlpA disulfide reductase family protein, partial [Candidatus Krumholzibacteria bacterium]|nr:TlpA disulfide reductase family protein [Candidatus Krumholzibacteria bacterium]